MRIKLGIKFIQTRQYNFSKQLGIDKGILQYNGGLMLKSGFIE